MDPSTRANIRAVLATGNLRRRLALASEALVHMHNDLPITGLLLLAFSGGVVVVVGFSLCLTSDSRCELAAYSGWRAVTSRAR